MEKRRKRIGNGLAGKRVGPPEYQPTPKEMKDIEQLRKVVAENENLFFQDLINCRGTSRYSKGENWVSRFP